MLGPDPETNRLYELLRRRAHPNPAGLEVSHHARVFRTFRAKSHQT